MQTYSFDEIYDCVTGEAPDLSQTPEVEDAFAEGSFCSTQYEIMWDAYLRLLARTNQPGEDPDVEIMRCALSSIQRELCRRMYHYGALYGKK